MAIQTGISFRLSVKTHNQMKMRSKMTNYRQLKLVDCSRSNWKLKGLKVRSIIQRISLTIITSLENVAQNMDDEAPTKIKFECESL